MIEEIAEIACKILGYLIGKAIFERIPLGCFLNRALIRKLCGQDIKFEDMYSVDKDLYNSWKFILDEPNIENMELTYSFVEAGLQSTLKEIELIPGGKEIKVTDENKKNFVRDA